MKKVILSIVIILLIGVSAVALYVKFGLPDVGNPSELKVEITPERIKHGEYLANHVSLCMDCHSTRDWTKFSGPIKEGTKGLGGEVFDQSMGFPGKFYSFNITPSHLSNWTDGEIFRTITTGVSKDGRAIFPVMPYSYYGRMDKEDLYDIIAYIRSLKPVESVTKQRSVDFPMSFILNTIPHKAEFSKKPPSSDIIKYGAYMINAAACRECHTPVKNGQIIESLAFSGGREFVFPNGIAKSANLTSDKETGIGSWDADKFVARFKAYEDGNNLATLKHNEINTVMPWNMFAGMDTSDLKAIFAYLQTIPPIKNSVVHFDNAKK